MSLPNPLCLVGMTICVAISWVVTGCDKENPSVETVGAPTVKMTIGQKNFTLEVAADEKSRNFGLMFRQSMPADHGVLFVFDEEEPLGFWMKNTYIPLDIIFVNSEGKVVSVRQMKPHDLNTVPSGGPARYAIELNQGAASDAGIKPGDQLTIPAVGPVSIKR